MTNAYRFSNDFKLFLTDDLLTLPAFMLTGDSSDRAGLLDRVRYRLTKQNRGVRYQKPRAKKDVVIGANATSFFN